MELSIPKSQDPAGEKAREILDEHLEKSTNIASGKHSMILGTGVNITADQDYQVVIADEEGVLVDLVEPRLQRVLATTLAQVFNQGVFAANRQVVQTKNPYFNCIAPGKEAK